MEPRVWCERFHEYLRACEYVEGSAYEYTREVRFFCEFLGERGVTEPHEIRREDIVSYQLLLHDLRKKDGLPLAAGTRTNKLKSVLSFLRYLRSGGFVVTSLGEHIRFPKIPDFLPPELPDEDQTLQLLDQPDPASPSGRRDRAILDLLYTCALRSGELRSLTLDAVDLHRLEVTVRYGKGKKSRRVPMSELTAVSLEAYLVEGRPYFEVPTSGGLLFLNSKGSRFRRDSLSKLVRDHAEAAGLPMKVTPHILRHACATHMLARKAGLRHLQRFLGHAKVSTTERYTRVEVSDLREVLMQCHPRESF